MKKNLTQKTCIDTQGRMEGEARYEFGSAGGDVEEICGDARGGPGRGEMNVRLDEVIRAAGNVVASCSTRGGPTLCCVALDTVIAWREDVGRRPVEARWRRALSDSARGLQGRIARGYAADAQGSLRAAGNSCRRDGLGERAPRVRECERTSPARVKRLGHPRRAAASDLLGQGC